MKRLLPMLACLSAPAFAASDGSLDPTFGNGGRTTIAFDLGGPSKDDDAANSVLQPDGKLVVVGSAFNANGNKDFAITRLLPNGMLDTSFAGGGKQTVAFDLSNGFNDRACCVQLLSDGRIVVAGTVAGSVSSATAASSAAIAVLQPDGTLDTSEFGGTGKYTYAFAANDPTTSANALALSESPSNTEALIVGTIGSGHALALRVPLGGVGTPLSTQLPIHAEAEWTTASAIGLLANGTVVVSGYYNEPATPANCFVARFLSAAFDLDSTFGGGGVIDIDSGSEDDCYDQAIDADGNIIVVGSFGNFTEGLEGFVAKVSADGSAVAWSTPFYFEGVGTGSESYPMNVQLQSDGKILVAGPESGGNFAVARFLPNGALDGTFIGSEPGSTPGISIAGAGAAFALSIDANDRVYVAGTVYGTSDDFGVARLLSDKIFGNGFDNTQ